MRRGSPTGAVVVASVASAGAGLIHAAAAGSHTGDQTLEYLFVATAVGQVSWAGLVTARANRYVIAAGVLLNAGAVAAWALSRTIGLPVIESLADRSPVGVQDTVAAALGTIAAGAACAAALGVRAPSWRPRESAIVVAVGLAMVFPAMSAGHTHGEESDHAHGDDRAVEAGVAPGELASADEHEEPTGPVISLDDPRLTATQRLAARDLIDETTAGMAGFPDVAAVEAAGYRSIGDGVSGFEHFVNWGFLTDGYVLDPARIESIVAEIQPDGSKKIVSAMYILEPSSTMADVPEVAGELTTWHDHRNLCWDDTGRIAGRLVDGVCDPGGTLRVTPPMLHVWMVEHPCGPFAGLEGHGGGCGHEH